jgi:hypothetical protein
MQTSEFYVGRVTEFVAAAPHEGRPAHKVCAGLDYGGGLPAEGIPMPLIRLLLRLFRLSMRLRRGGGRGFGRRRRMF